MDTEDLIAVRYGSVQARKSALYLRFATNESADAAQGLDFYFWLLRSAKRTILIDTGFDPAAAARRGRETLVAPLDALASLGVRPRDVDTVVVTHFHYDHIGNLAAFASAQVLVPAVELAFWRSPISQRPQFREHVDAADLAAVEQIDAAGRLRAYTDGDALAPGLTAVSLPGHTPGLCGVLIDRPGRNVLLTSDAVHLYEELERDWPFGLVWNLESMYQSYERVRSLAVAEDTVVVPGHDPEVESRHAAVPGASGVAVLLG